MVEGFVIVLFICGAIFLATLFFKDIPVDTAQSAGPAAAEIEAVQQAEAVPLGM